MAKVKPVVKQPFESFFIAGSFAKVLTDGETIDVDKSVVVAYDKEGKEYPDLIDEPSKTVDDKQLSIRIKDGKPELSPFKVSFRAVTSANNKWEVDAPIEVQEK
jgi:hypothetical protein